MPDAQMAPGPAMVKASFSLPVGKAFLHASAHVPAGQTTLTQLLPIVQNLQNAVIGKVAEEAEAAGSPISCRAGCGACCRQLVPLSLFEAEALAEWMRTLGDDRRAELEARFERALSALREAGLIDRILKEDRTRNDGPATELAIDYFRARVACPFLENECCSIHPIRPLACREYLVTSPAELCQDPAGNDLTAVVLPLNLSHTLCVIGREVTDDPRGWIPLVFLPAWDKSGMRPGDYVTGTGEEILRRILDTVAREKEEQAQKTE